MTNVGKEIVNTVLRNGDIEPFLKAGLDLAWMTSNEDLSHAAVFSEADRDAYLAVLRRYEAREKVPSLAWFRHSFPPENYTLPKTVMDADELVDMATEDRKRVQYITTGSDLLDFIEAGDYEGAHEAAQKMLEHGTGGDKMVLTPMSAIKTRPVRWLWDGRIPIGHLSLMAGKPDVGKSQMGVWEAAMLSRGSLPGEYYGTPHGVLYVGTEDSYEQTIKPRLEAADADLDRVYRLDSLARPGKGYTLNVVRDLTEMGRIIRGNDIVLSLFDPLVSVVGGSEWNKAEEVRGALEPLTEMFQETRSTGAGLMHFRKALSDDILTQISGSGAWAQVVRSVIALVRDPDEDEKTIIVSQVKNNLGRGDLPSLTFTFRPVDVESDEDIPASVSKIVWGEDSCWSAEDILNGRNTEKAKGTHDLCKDWMAAFLKHGNPVLREEVMAAGEIAGFSKSSLNRAKADLPMITARTRGSHGPHTWQLDLSKIDSGKPGKSGKSEKSTPY